MQRTTPPATPGHVLDLKKASISGKQLFAANDPLPALSEEDRRLAAMFNGGAAADHLTLEPSRGFIASERAIAGNPLYFTGIENFTLVNSPWLSHAKVFDTAEQAQAAVEPWNALGHRFEVWPKPLETATEYAQRRARENDRRALELQVNDPFVR